MVVYHPLRKSARTLPLSNIHYILIGRIQKGNMRRVIIKQVFSVDDGRKKLHTFKSVLSHPDISSDCSLWMPVYREETSVRDSSGLWDEERQWVVGEESETDLKRERNRKSEMYVLQVKDGGVELKWRGRNKFKTSE